MARRLPPRIVAGYVATAALVTSAYAVWSARASQSWIMGEWLISYRGGFVRRGLIGELVGEAARAAHVPPVTVALTVQVLLYCGFYAAVWLLARRVRWTVPLLLLFFSPATVAFLPLDPPSSVRKEVLLYLAVALLCLRLRGGSRAGDRWTGAADGATTASWWQRHRGEVLLAAALAGTTVLIVLAHEGLVFFLPYLLAPVLLARRAQGRESPGAGLDAAGVDAASGREHSWRAGLLVCVPAVLAGLLAAAASVDHPGDAATAEAICRPNFRACFSFSRPCEMI